MSEQGSCSYLWQKNCRLAFLLYQSSMMPVPSWCRSFSLALACYISPFNPALFRLSICFSATASTRTAGLLLAHHKFRGNGNGNGNGNGVVELRCVWAPCARGMDDWGGGPRGGRPGEASRPEEARIIPASAVR